MDFINFPKEYLQIHNKQNTSSSTLVCFEYTPQKQDFLQYNVIIHVHKEKQHHKDSIPILTFLEIYPQLPELNDTYLVKDFLFTQIQAPKISSFKNLHIQAKYFLGEESGKIDFFDVQHTEQKTHILILSTKNLELMNEFQCNYSENFFEKKDFLESISSFSYTYITIYHKTFAVEVQQKGDHSVVGLSKNSLLRKESPLLLFSANIQEYLHVEDNFLQELPQEKNIFTLLESYILTFNKKFQDFTCMYIWLDPRAVFMVPKEGLEPPRT